MEENNKYFIGDIKFNNPILNASGCWCMNEEQLDELYSSSLGGIVSKTSTIFSKEGNSEPNYYYSKENNAHFNCKGLPNFGYQYYRKLSKKYTEKPYIISLAFDNYDDLKVLLNDYEKYADEKPFLVELNVSCPNLHSSTIIGYNSYQFNKLLNILKSYNLKNINFGLKMPPYLQLDLMDEIVKIVNEFTDIIKYIVLSNSIPNCVLLNKGQPVLSKIVGGMSGKTNKCISLSNVMYFSRILNKEIKIIGCGGIDSLEDVKDYLNNGASFVHLASCFYDVESNRLSVDKINSIVKEFLQK